MPYTRTEQPLFSWSHSRQRTLDACPRRYYWRYYAAHNGWERGAPAVARAAWTLKQLTTYPMALGTAIHEQARRVASAVRAGRPAPDYGALHDGARAALNGLYRRSRDRAAFLAAPSRHPITEDAYYGREPAPERFEQLRERLGRCLTNLLDQPLWDALAGLPPSAVRLIDTVATVTVDGVVVYVAPDLVFRTPHGGWVVLDWKTGAPDADGAGAQLAQYALYVRDALGLAPWEGAYEGRVVDLGTGRTTVFRVQSDDLAAARARVAGGVARMRAYLRDAPRNVPLPADAFPLAADRRSCRTCPFRELCAPALA